MVYVNGSQYDMIVDVKVSNLVLRQPKTLSPDDPNDLVGFRSGDTTSGVVDSVTFIGQAALIAGGPWQISNNDYQGALADTVVTQAFTTRDNAHDLTIIDNRIHQDFSGGITRRFLYMRAATYTTISGNKVYGGVGSPSQGRDWPNLPESLLTDDMDPFYLGKPAAVSGNGYVLKINTLRNGDSPAPGDVISVLDGAYVGSWYRIAQVIDRNTYLMLDPLPTSLSSTISLNYGYFYNTIDHNSWDFTTVGLDSRNVAIKLAGAQFCVAVTNNNVKSAFNMDNDNTDGDGVGAADSFVIGGSQTQSPPGTRGSYPAPDLWVRTPCFVMTISGNLIEDADAMLVFAEGEVRFRDTSPLTFFTGSVTNNTTVLSSAYLTGIGSPSKQGVIAIGDPNLVNTAQYILSSVTGNAVVLPTGSTTTGVIRYNNGLTGSPTDVTLGAAPAAPSTLTATASTSATRIDLAWSAVSSVTSYLIERSPNGETGWAEVAAVASGTTAYQDTGVIAGRSYVYRIRTRTGSGTSSPYSAKASAVALSPTAGTTAPTTLTVRAFNQDGANYVQKSASGNAGTNTVQDVHLELSGLRALEVLKVDLQGPSMLAQYNKPAGSDNANGYWRAELVRSGLSPVADLYFEAGSTISPSSAFMVTVTYTGGTVVQGPITFYGVSVADINLPMPALSVVSLNQDGADLVGPGAGSSGDGKQDTHLRLNGLKATADVSSITVAATGISSVYNAPAGSDNGGGSWRAEFLRQGRSTTGDLYLQLAGVDVNAAFTVTVNYTVGDPQTATFYGVTAPSTALAMPSLSALALNQDGRDLVGQGPSAGSDGKQDVHVALYGLNTARAISRVDVTSDGIDSRYYAPLHGTNPNGSWRAELVRDGLSSRADLYFGLGSAITADRVFTIKVTYADGIVNTCSLAGVVVSDPALAVAPRLTVGSLGQDGGDLVGMGAGSVPDDKQDVHLVLSGLSPATIQTVVITAPSFHTEYNRPFGSSNPAPPGYWRAEVLRQGTSAMADLYFQPGAAISASTVFTITVTYANATPSQSATLTGLTVTNSTLAVTTSSTTPIEVSSLNQDGANIVSGASTAGLGSNNIQDVHLFLSGLNPARYITKIQIQASGISSAYNAPFASNNPDSSWRAELIRQGLATVADLYFETSAAISASTVFTITVTYASGAVAPAFSLKGVVVANPSLAMPGLSAVALNQDGSDLVGTTYGAGPDQKQDVHVVLAGLNTAQPITRVDITAAGINSQYNAPFGTSNPTPANLWRAELIRQGFSSTADLYFQLGTTFNGSTPFTITVTYADGPPKPFVLYGIAAAKADLPVARLINVGQDNHDFTGPVSATRDGYQDNHFQITGIAAGLTVSNVTIVADGMAADVWEYNGASSSHPVQVVQPQGGGTTADLYFQPTRKDRCLRRYRVSVVLSDGTVLRFVLDGISAESQLADA